MILHQLKDALVMQGCHKCCCLAPAGTQAGNIGPDPSSLTPHSGCWPGSLCSPAGSGPSLHLVTQECPSPWLPSTAIKPGSCVIAHPAFPQHPHFFPKPQQVSGHHKALSAKAGWGIPGPCSRGSVVKGVLLGSLDRSPGAVQGPCCAPQLP